LAGLEPGGNYLKGLEWTKEEIEALQRLVRLGRLDINTFSSVFPYRTPAAVRKKFYAMRDHAPEEWTPPSPHRAINWDAIEILEDKCQQEQSAKSETSTQGQNLL